MPSILDYLPEELIKQLTENSDINSLRYPHGDPRERSIHSSPESWLIQEIIKKSSPQREQVTSRFSPSSTDSSGGFVPKHSPINSVTNQLPFNSNIPNVFEAENSRKEQNRKAMAAAERAYAPHATSNYLLQLLSLLAPGAKSSTPFQRSMSPLAGARIQRPRTGSFTEYMQRDEILPEAGKPAMPSSGNTIKPSYKFTNKGGKEYLKRQELSSRETPKWVKEGAEKLADLFRGMSTDKLDGKTRAKRNLEEIGEAIKKISGRKKKETSIYEYTPQKKKVKKTSFMDDVFELMKKFKEPGYYEDEN
jgi:hypothetical protein